MARTIHVSLGGIAFGDPAELALREALSIGRDDVAVLRDELSCGPLPATDNLERWRTTRLGYWDDFARKVSGSPRKRRFRAPSWARDLVTGLDRLAAADQIVIWLGRGLGDQLALASLPWLLRLLGKADTPIRVVQFDRGPSGRPISSVRILDADRLRNHPPEYDLTEDDRRELDDAWAAVTAPEPSALVRMARRKSGRLPFLRAAIARLLRHYPDARTGLNIHEARLLASTRDNGPLAARIISETMAASNRVNGDGVGDNWLFARLRGLADPACPHPAVILTGARVTIRLTRARLTPDGHRFLEGSANFVEQNGIDDWVGGVHLDSKAGNVWCFDNENHTLVRGVE